METFCVHSFDGDLGEKIDLIMLKKNIIGLQCPKQLLEDCGTNAICNGSLPVPEQITPCKVTQNSKKKKCKCIVNNKKISLIQDLNITKSVTFGLCGENASICLVRRD